MLCILIDPGLDDFVQYVKVSWYDVLVGVCSVFSSAVCGLLQ